MTQKSLKRSTHLSLFASNIKYNGGEWKSFKLFEIEESEFEVPASTK